ncbi:MAG TPA: flavodoxin family protein [Anaerolineae bacterium]|nr:flavodoxin family protein [Anaerolineae bacterium]
MKKVTAFVGSARRKHTYEAVVQFLGHLRSLGEIEAETVRLHDYRLEYRRGCKVCFAKGEEHCPLKDDRDLLVEKMTDSDGVVFASPNYSIQLSGMMKTFLDRLGFAMHRPRFFGKTFTSIVTQGVGFGGKIVDYLDFAAKCVGYTTVKGICFTALEPMTLREGQILDRILAGHARRYPASLEGPGYPAPSLLMLMGFRMARTSIRLELDDSSRDYQYFAEKGWLESDYSYPTHLGSLKKGSGKVFDAMQVRRTKARHAQPMVGDARALAGQARTRRATRKREG